MALRTNRVPWSDELILLSYTETVDSDGYVTKTETRRGIFCTFVEGTNRTEFYEAYKAGLRLSASCELWEADYQGEQKCEFNGKLYSIVRAYTTGNETLELSLSEDIR